MASVLERHAPYKFKKNDWLVKHSYNITSQGGEDGVIAQIFQLLDQHENKPARRWCVEFGAWDGKHLSNTWQLLYNQPNEWSGVLIEADAERVQQMQAMYANHSNVTCVNRFIALDGDSDRLECILKGECPVLPVEFDLISIDVDGADYHIWNELTQYHPKVVIIEFNPTIPNHIVYIQARSTNIYHGSSLAALIELGKMKGYELVSTTTFNAFFVQAQYYDLFQISDNSIHEMHDVPMPTEFFQLYDGTIKLTGCKKLIWKNLPISEDAIQILPASARAFPFLPSEHDVISTADKVCQAMKEGAQAPDYAYFIQIAIQAYGKYPPNDLQRVVQCALQVDPTKQKEALEAVKTTSWQLYEGEVQQRNHVNAVSWLKFLLQVDPICNPTERAVILSSMGECLVRDRAFEEAEFYLQTSLAIDSQSKATLKSLAKLYTKTKQEQLQQEMIERIRALDVSK